MKKFLMIFGGVVLGFIVLAVIIFSLTYFTSKRLVCKSDEGNITLMYNDKTIKGYLASGISYNLEEQKIIANEIGIDEYINEFTTFFTTNTTGSCERK